MTKLEAIERAKRIWGDRATVSPSFSPGPRPPGQVEWAVDVNEETHAFDCNGHTLCHNECALLEEAGGSCLYTQIRPSAAHMTRAFRQCVRPIDHTGEHRFGSWIPDNS